LHIAFILFQHKLIKYKKRFAHEIINYGPGTAIQPEQPAIQALHAGGNHATTVHPVRQVVYIIGPAFAISKNIQNKSAKNKKYLENIF
jgi:hypothetical protein